MQLFSIYFQARSSIVGNSTSAVDAQQVFKDMFKSLINKIILLVLILIGIIASQNMQYQEWIFR